MAQRTTAIARLRRLAGQIRLAADAVAGGGPLAGVKVLDFTAYQNGPSATVQLADNGADVLKVEPPEGDGVRSAAGKGQLPHGFEAYNRGKRSIIVDLKHPKAKELVEKLVKWADVVTENFRPQVMDSLGLGYDQLSKWNPSVILASNSGFGAEGEWASRPSFDAIAQAFTGAMTAQGGGPAHPPQLIEWAFSDEVGAMNFYSTIVTALFARGQTGKGQHVVTSQTAATLHFQRLSVNAGVRNNRQRDDGKPAGFPNRHIQQLHCAGDGKWFMISLGQRAQYRRFVEHCLKRPDILETEFGKKFPSRDGRDWIIEQIAAVVKTQPRDHWLDLCNEHSVPAGPCSSYSDVGDENGTVGRHMLANGYIQKIKHRDYGDMKVVGPPAHYKGTPNNHEGSTTLHAPDLGEHTASTLRDMGYSDADVTAFMAEGGATPAAKGRHAKKR